MPSLAAPPVFRLDGHDGPVLTLAADVGSKAWAERRLDAYPGMLEVWKNHLALVLAKNRGGAWGLLQSTSENVRRPFFLLVSVAAIGTTW